MSFPPSLSMTPIIGCLMENEITSVNSVSARLINSSELFSSIMLYKKITIQEVSTNVKYFLFSISLALTDIFNTGNLNMINTSADSADIIPYTGIGLFSLKPELYDARYGWLVSSIISAGVRYIKMVKKIIVCG